MTSLAILALVSVGGFSAAWAYLQQTKFGRLPEGEHFETIKRSPHYVNGEFRNLVETPMFADGSSFVSILLKAPFNRGERLAPSAAVPSVKTNLKALSVDKDTVVWLGHSSYFIQLGGKRILIDPVFSTSAAPMPGANQAFDGSTVYSAEDMPKIDYLLISHDHWDHLDYPSVAALRSKVGEVICGLGLGAYFEHWGYPKARIHELDWYGVLELDKGIKVHVLPARHYSGRLLTKNQTLWAAFAVEAPERKVFFGGDSGYGPHFAEIGRRFGGFDLVALDMGQYDARWPYIHMVPEQAARAAEDLRANALLPAHVGKFAIARHSWDEPFKRIVAASEGRSYRLLTPRIGEPIEFDEEGRSYMSWWRDIESARPAKPANAAALSSKEL